MTREEVFEKVQKLLRLAQSSNQHEAALAAARAAELCARYEIAQAEIDVADEAPPLATQEVEVDRWPRRVLWKGVLAVGVAQGLGCGAMLKGDRLVFFGVVGAVQTAQYVYAALHAEVVRIAGEQYAVSRGPEVDREAVGRHYSYKSHERRQWTLAFANGCASEIAARMRAARAETRTTATTTALVRVDQAAEAVAAWSANAKAPKVNKVHADARAWAAGKRAGAAVDLGTAARPGLGAGAKKLTD